MKIRNINDLNARIRNLQERKEIQEKLIAAEFSNLKNELKPANLIRNAWKNIRQSPESRREIIENAAELGLKMLINRFTGGKSRSLLSSLLRTGAEMGLEKLSETQNDNMRSIGATIYNIFFKRKNPA